MLSRPALGIRRLISRGKQGIEAEEDPFYLHDEIDTIKASYKEGKSRTWRTPMMRRPNSKSNFDIPRSEDIHRISLIPPFPDTPHSSRSSLCSCENGTSHSSPRSSPGLPYTQSPRSSPLLRPRHHVEQTQHGHGRGASRSPPRIPIEHPHSPPPTPQPSQHRATPEPESDVSDMIPLAFEVEEERKQSEDGSGGYSDNIQQLIRETDEAFKFDAFVEANLPEVREAVLVQGFDQNQEQTSIPPTPTRLTRARSQRLSQPSLKSPTTKPYVKASLQPNAGGARGSKTKRTKSKKARRKSRATATQPSRWGLSESAKDLFTIRIFSRIEADEMLPESTLHEIRMSRASHNQWAKYKESMVTGVETSESGSPRIADSPNASPGLSSTAEEVDGDTSRSSVSKSEEIDRDSCATPKPEPQPHEQYQAQSQQYVDAAATDVDIGMEDDEDTLPIMMIMDESKTKPVATIPVSPPKRSSPRRLPSRQLPPLPTIPEVIAIGPENAVLSPTSILPAVVPGSTSKINKDDYVFFPSTRYTITMPTFSHGAIRLAKADLPIGKLAAAVDDTLDWTAFQMAILGGAGDFFSEPTDYSRPSEAELSERDDIASWFADFGLGGFGTLASEDESPLLQPADTPRSIPSYKTKPTIGRIPGGKRRSSRITTTPSATSEQRRSHAASNAPIPVIVEHSSSPTTPKAAREPRTHQKQLTPKEMGFQPLIAKAQPKRFLSAGGGADAAPRTTLNHIGLAIDSTRRPSVDSVQSLPQSPMLDLVVSRDVDGNEYVVPMGFNLGHDLGDFLKWEAENVFAMGYGSDAS